MEQLPIAGDIASKITSSSQTAGAGFVLPDPANIKEVRTLLPIEEKLRSAYLSNFPEAPIWRPPAVSEAMREIALFVGSNQFVLLLLLKYRRDKQFSAILLQHLYNTKRYYLPDTYPNDADKKKNYVIWHILQNVLRNGASKPVSFDERDKINDDRRVLAFDLIDDKRAAIKTDQPEGGTTNGSAEDAAVIANAVVESTNLLQFHFEAFVRENPRLIATAAPGIDGQLTFFEKVVVPRVNSLIAQTSQTPEVFPSQLESAVREIVYRFDRELKLQNMPDMQFEDIYDMTPDQQTYFVAAVHKYLIYTKMAIQPNFRTLQFDSANKDATIAVTFAILHHFQNWKNGKINRLRFF